MIVFSFSVHIFPTATGLGFDSFNRILNLSIQKGNFNFILALF